ncbi:MAG: efflux RND transporter permease subunit [Bryobacterales bacterium]
MRFLLHDVVRTVVTDVRSVLRFLGRLILTVLAPILDAFDRLFGWVTDRYPRVLRSSLEHKGTVLAIVTLSCLGAWALSGTLGGELIPPMTQGEFSFEIKTPEGTRIERTDEIVRQVEDKVREYPEVASVFSSVGGSQQNQFAAGVLEENYGQIHVSMKNKTDKVAEEDVISRIRGELASYPDTVHTLSRPTLFSFKTPVEVEIFGFDLDEQRQAADLIAARLAQVPGSTTSKRPRASATPRSRSGSTVNVWRALVWKRTAWRKCCATRSAATWPHAIARATARSTSSSAPPKATAPRSTTSATSSSTPRAASARTRGWKARAAWARGKVRDKGRAKTSSPSAPRALANSNSRVHKAAPAADAPLRPSASRKSPTSPSHAAPARSAASAHSAPRLSRPVWLGAI